MKNKLLALFLSLAILVSVIPGKILAAEFTDMKEDWAKEALERAVENGLLKVDEGKVRGRDYLTRAEMATILNRCFNAKAKVSLNGFDDVSKDDWFYEEMEKALAMSVFQGDGKRLNPKKQISREEVFVVLSRAFQLSDENEMGLGNFIDSDEISFWAKAEVAALVSQGYISGADGKLNPRKNITRAESAKLMDNLVKTYINSSGEYNEDYKGNIMINKEGVILKGSTIEGNIIIADGVGEGEVILEDVNLKGKLLVRGGGKDSIIIKGESKIGNIIAVDSKDSNIVYYENLKPKQENTKIETKPEIKERKKSKRSSSSEFKEKVEEPEVEIPEDKVDLKIKSVQVLDSNNLKVILSDDGEHNIILEEPLTDGIETEVEFIIGGKKYKANVIWNKPVVEDKNFTYDGVLEIIIEYGSEFTNPIVKDDEEVEIIPTGEVNVNEAGEYILTYKEEGYKDLVIKVIVSEKVPEDPIVDEEVSGTGLTVGETLEEAELLGTFKNKAGTEIDGDLTWADIKSVVSVKGKYGWVFTPKDIESYNVVTGELELVADRANVGNAKEFTQAVSEGVKNINLENSINIKEDEPGYKITNRLYYNVDNGVIDLKNNTLEVVNDSLCLSGNKITIKNGTIYTHGYYGVVINGKDILIKDIRIIGGIDVRGKENVRGSFIGPDKYVSVKIENSDITNANREYIIHIQGTGTVTVESGKLDAKKTTKTNIAFRINNPGENSIIIKKGVKLKLYGIEFSDERIIQSNL